MKIYLRTGTCLLFNPHLFTGIKRVVSWSMEREVLFYLYQGLAW